MTGPGRGFRRRRGVIKTHTTDPATAPIVRVTINNAAPANFEPPDTDQLSVSVFALVRFEESDGAASVQEIEVTGRTITYGTSNGSLATVSVGGLVTAVAPGSPTITATCEGVSASSVYVVSAPQNAVSTVNVTPTSVTIQVGGAFQLAAVVRDASSNVLLGKTVTWSEQSGASLITTGADSGDEAHTVIVQTTGEGSASVRATCESVNSNTASITITAAGATYPNEPASFTRICEADFAVLPTNPASQNQVAGSWWRDSDAATVANLSVVDGASVPQSSPKVLQARFPNGWEDGSGPVDWSGWEAGSPVPHYTEIYASFQVKILGSDYQNQSVGTKLWYVPYGNTNRENHSFLLLGGSGSGQSLQSAMSLNWYFTNMNANGSDPGGGAVGRSQNSDATQYFTVGSWHQIEVYLKRNTLNIPPTADGLYKLWIDGHLVSNYSNMTYCSTSNPRGFYKIRADMVYGGDSGNVRSREDNIQIDHIYVSGAGRSTS